MEESIKLVLDPDVPDLNPQDVIDFQQECLNKLKDEIMQLKHINSDLEIEISKLRAKEYYDSLGATRVIADIIRNHRFILYLKDDKTWLTVHDDVHGDEHICLSNYDTDWTYPEVMGR